LRRTRSAANAGRRYLPLGPAVFDHEVRVSTKPDSPSPSRKAAMPSSGSPNDRPLRNPITGTAGLLRARRKRPRDRGTAESLDEFTPPHDQPLYGAQTTKSPICGCVVRHSKGRPRMAEMGQERRYRPWVPNVGFSLKAAPLLRPRRTGGLGPTAGIPVSPNPAIEFVTPTGRAPRISVRVPTKASAQILVEPL
jgi:hypothetical protein